MSATRTSARRVEFGDFQTPEDLARAVVECVHARATSFASLVEPTCGEGSLLHAALAQWPSMRVARGFEIDPRYVERAREQTSLHVGAPNEVRVAAPSASGHAALTNDHVNRPVAAQHNAREDLRGSNGVGANACADLRVEQLDFFRADWPRLLADLPEPILVLGNPPWVTKATLGALASSNVPSKHKRPGLVGLAALTGKSNFDVSEWMILRLLEALGPRDGWVAMLCKSSVARRVLAHAWSHSHALSEARVHSIDAQRHFGAAVDACLLSFRTGHGTGQPECLRLGTLTATAGKSFGFRAGRLVADLELYARRRHLAGTAAPRWRSGIKHDATKVMEFTERNGALFNGLNERVELEEEFLYPLRKGSELSRALSPAPTRWMLVPQRATGDDTQRLREHAPRVWTYLEAHGAILDQRRSSIYTKRCRFAIFGVGPYSFAPWKVAILGFSKRLSFKILAPHQGRPVMLDDTACFLPCRSAEEAALLLEILESDAAQEFLAAFVFSDSKRPVTIELLSQLDLGALAQELGRGADFARWFAPEPEGSA